MIPGCRAAVTLMLAIPTAMAVASGPVPAHAQTSASSANPLARLTGTSGSAGAQSAWVKGYNSTVRLIAGAAPSDGPGGRRLIAGIEIRLADGWKTYWRNPGDDGGMPPSLDWSGSRNLRSARLMFPAPERMKSVGGTAIGYTRSVVLPIEIEPAAAGAPVELALALEYGICREICVPAEARLQLTLAPMLAAMPSDLAQALARVPRPIGVSGPTSDAGASPLRSAKAVLAGAAPALTFDIAPTGDQARTDLFVEAPAGAYLPVPTRLGAGPDGTLRFRIDLKGVEDAGELAGKTLRLTVTGAMGGVELDWIVK